MRKILMIIALCVAVFGAENSADLKKCEANEAEGCVEVALNLPMNAQNRDKILTLLKRSCTLNSPRGCFYAGSVYTLDEGRDYAKANFYMEKSCKMGFAKACWNLGYLYTYGLGVKKDDAKALKLYNKSCDLGYGVGCEAAGLWYKDQKDEANHLKYIKLACDKGHTDSCSNLGYMYERGSGAEFNLLEAMKFYNLACNGDDQLACYALGYIYEQGADGIVAKPKEALRLYERACSLGEKHSCDEVKRLKSVMKD